MLHAACCMLHVACCMLHVDMFVFLLVGHGFHMLTKVVDRAPAVRSLMAIMLVSLQVPDAQNMHTRARAHTRTSVCARMCAGARARAHAPTHARTHTTTPTHRTTHPTTHTPTHPHTHTHPPTHLPTHPLTLAHRCSRTCETWRATTCGSTETCRSTCQHVDCPLVTSTRQLVNMSTDDHESARDGPAARVALQRARRGGARRVAAELAPPRAGARVQACVRSCVWVSACPSVRPSVRPSVPGTGLVHRNCGLCAPSHLPGGHT